MAIQRELVVTTPTSIEAIAITATHIYWVWNENPSFIGRSLLDGSESEPEWLTIPFNEGGEWVQGLGLDTDGIYLYFSTEQEVKKGGEFVEFIGRCKLDGSEFEPTWIEVGTTETIEAVVVSEGFIYFLSFSGWVGRVKTNGTGLEPKIAKLHWGNDGILLVTSTRIYVFENTSEGKECHLDGTEVKAAKLPSAVSGVPYISGEAIDRLIFVHQTGGNSQIGRIDFGATGVAGYEEESLLEIPEGSLYGLHADATHLYWIENFPAVGGGHAIGRCLLTDLGAETRKAKKEAKELEEKEAKENEEREAKIAEEARAWEEHHGIVKANMGLASNPGAKTSLLSCLDPAKLDGYRLTFECEDPPNNPFEDDWSDLKGVGGIRHVIRANATHIFWSHGSFIGRMKIDGTEVLPEFVNTQMDKFPNEGFGEVYEFDIDATHIYWLGGSHPLDESFEWGGWMGRCLIDGNDVEPEWVKEVAGFEYFSYPMVVTSTHIYFTKQNFEGNNFISRVKIDGTEVNHTWHELSFGGFSPIAMTADENYLYYSHYHEGGKIGRVKRDGTGDEPNWVSAGFVQAPGSLIIQGGYIWFSFFNTNDIPETANHADICRVKLDGTGLEERIWVLGPPKQDDQVDGLATDGEHIYWANITAGIVGRALLTDTNHAPPYEPEFRVAIERLDGGSGTILAQSKIKFVVKNQVFALGVEPDGKVVAYIEGSGELVAIEPILTAHDVTYGRGVVAVYGDTSLAFGITNLWAWGKLIDTFEREENPLFDEGKWQPIAGVSDPGLTGYAGYFFGWVPASPSGAYWFEEFIRETLTTEEKRELEEKAEEEPEIEEDEIYPKVLPLMFRDRVLGHPALKYFMGIDTMWNDLRHLIRDQVGKNGTVRPGYADIMDVNTAPAKWLPWLGQFVGVTVPPGTPAAEARILIKNVGGFHRGTRAAIIKAGELTLTGSKRVHVFERFEHAYKILIVTFIGETPDEALTRQALEEALPAGIMMFYEAVAAWIYEELVETKKTYKELIEEYAPVDYIHLVKKEP